MILRAYQYVFYHIQCWSTRTDRFPEMTAFFTVGIAVAMNLATLICLLNVPFNLRGLPDLSIATIIMIGFLTLIPQYFAALKGKRYQEIEARYKDESVREKRRGAIIASAYWIGSLLLMLLVGLGTYHLR